MSIETAWMTTMVVMFGLFLLGLWIEARRTLRALDEANHEAEDARNWQMDYQVVMARRAARRKLRTMRRDEMRRDVIHNLGLDRVDLNHLVDKMDLDNLVFARSGARTHSTREGRKVS